MRAVNRFRTPGNFPVLDHPLTEQNEDLGLLVLEDGVITPYTPEEEGAKPLRLVYLSGGREIELGSSTSASVAWGVLCRAINEFQCLLAEMADENQDRPGIRRADVVTVIDHDFVGTW
jgi:hypothetical protein